MKRSRSQHWCSHHLPNHRCRLSCFSLLCYFCFLSLTSFKQTINWFNLEHPNCQTNLCVFRLLSLQYPDGKVCSLSLFNLAKMQIEKYLFIYILCYNYMNQEVQQHLLVSCYSNCVHKFIWLFYHSHIYISWKASTLKCSIQIIMNFSFIVIDIVYCMCF